MAISGQDSSTDPQTPSSRLPWWFYLGLLAISLLGAYLRFSDVNKDSYWLDELFTLRAMGLPDLGSLIHEIESDVHPPLYYILSWVLCRLGGDCEWLLRAFSAGVGTLSVPVLGWLGARLAGPWVGLGSAAFLAVNNFHLFFSRESRPYALFCLLAILSFGFLLACFRSARPHRLVFYALSSAAMLYTHYIASAVLPFQGLSIVLLARQLGRASFFKLMVAIAAAGVLYLPWLPAQLHDMASRGAFGPRLDYQVFQDLMHRWWTPDPFLALLTYGLLILGIAYLLRAERHALLTVLLLWMLGPLFLVYYRSLLTTTVWLPKSLIPCLPAWILLMGLGLKLVKPTSLRLFLVGAIMFCTLISSRQREVLILGNRGRVHLRDSSRWIAHLNRSTGFPIYIDTVPELIGWYLSTVGAAGWTGKGLPSDPALLPPVFWLLEGHSALSPDMAKVLQQQYRLAFSKPAGPRAALWASTSSSVPFDAFSEIGLDLGPQFVREPEAQPLSIMLASLRPGTAFLIVSSDDFYTSMSPDDRQAVRQLVGPELAPKLARRSSLAAVVKPNGQSLARVDEREVVEIQTTLRAGRGVVQVDLVGGSYYDPRPAGVVIDRKSYMVGRRGLTIFRLNLRRGRVLQVWTMDTSFGAAGASFRWAKPQG